MHPRHRTIVKHYNAGDGTKRTLRNPDAELDAALAKRNRGTSEPSLRGIGVVNGRKRRNLKVSRRRHVRRNEGYIAANGAWIATVEAPYLEFAKDVGYGRQARTRSNAAVGATQATQARVNQDIALQARMGTIHTGDDN